MALPFLKSAKSQAGGVMTKVRAPDNAEQNPEQDQDDSGLEAVAGELISAIQSNNAKGVADALRSAFDILEMEPHEEGEHIGESEEEMGE